MEELRKKILSEGKICANNIVKVDSFLNHQLDVGFMKKIGKEIASRFKGEKIDKILTIESSGIAIACYVAEEFNCRVVFAKKGKSLNQSKDCFEANVYSYTRGGEYTIRVSKEFLHKGENVLIVDDFLANGAAINGLMNMVNEAGAHLVGCSVVIEKGFQPGGDNLRAKGIKLESLAILDVIDEANQTITFKDEK